MKMLKIADLIRVVERCSPEGCWEECPFYKYSDCDSARRAALLETLREYDYCRYGCGMNDRQMPNDYVLGSDVVAVLKTMHQEGYCVGNNEAMFRIFEELANLKMVEAEPVVHAHWEYDGCFKCSACHTEAISHDLDGVTSAHHLTTRCPECGAHMDEGVVEWVKN